MGRGSSKIPALSDKDVKTVLAYNLREEHLVKLLRLFKEVDADYIGAWSVVELFKLSLEARLSVRAPIIEALFFMGDSRSEGSWTFPDFLVTLTSFCALSREEVLQFFFIILDGQRNGMVKREEMLEFFSYVPVGCHRPVFPVNNNNALEKFRCGKWTNLEFDGLAQLCEYFPYVAYPAYHTQEIFRKLILGKSFWERFDKDRRQIVNRSRRVTRPGSKGHEKVHVVLPVRCTMQELLEFSRRKTALNNGKRVRSQNTERTSSKLTVERDLELQRCPILRLIRNPRCMYHVPTEDARQVAAGKSTNKRPEFELSPTIGGAGDAKKASLTLDAPPRPSGNMTGRLNGDQEEGQSSEEEEDSEEELEEEEEEEEDSDPDVEEDAIAER